MRNPTLLYINMPEGCVTEKKAGKREGGRESTLE